MNVTKTTTTPCVGGTQTPKIPGTSAEFAKVMAEQAAGKEVALEPKPGIVQESKAGTVSFGTATYSRTIQKFDNKDSLEGDALFAAIVNHYKGEPDFFWAMVGQLEDAGLITAKQAVALLNANGIKFDQERELSERTQGKGFNLDDFIKNYFFSLSFDDLLLELVDSLKIKPEAQAIVSKISNILSQNNTQEVNINE
ncbi:MAG: hypothetical protein FWH04_09685 [Oscillospiraceae bacterium]|nr:hypothetical protein [Oscillospiraceae bacterium]